jgi:hypothetical protein
VPVELSRLDLSLPAETTVAENVSSRGARVVSRQRWQEGDRVLVKALKGDLRWQAQVVYCEILPRSTFAIGLKLVQTADWWERGLTAARRVVTNVPRSEPPSFKHQSLASRGYGAY